MSIIENIAVTHLTDQPSTTEQAPTAGVELVTLPALNVSIENNVRTAADLDPAFLASVKQHGVLLPTIGYRDQDGRVVVRDGQMRVLAAIEAGCDVPVFVTARDDNTARRGTP
jgi:ParB family chromosome partitioning protein